jgi:hypothetical protein
MDKCDLRFEEFVCSAAYDEKVERYILGGKVAKLLSLFAEFCFHAGWEAHELSAAPQKALGASDTTPGKKK